MPDGSTWKLRFSTHLQFRKCRNRRICLLLFRDRSKGGKKSKVGKKKEASENREGKHSKKQQRASPHRPPPSAQFGGCCPPTWSHCCRRDTRSHLGRRKALSLLTSGGRSRSQRQGREQGHEPAAPHAAPAALPPEGRSGSLPAAPEHLHFLLPAGEHLSCISSGDGLSLMGFRK